MDIFEQASRQKLRFPSPVGDLTAEQLWDLPLAKAGRMDLDSLARAVHREAKALEEGSFVELVPDPRKARAELQLDILKRVISVKMAEAAAAEKARELAERRRRLLAALDNQEASELANMTRDELLAELAATGGG